MENSAERKDIQRLERPYKWGRGGMDVTMSVVSGSISAADVELCRKIAEADLGVKFRVR